MQRMRETQGEKHKEKSWSWLKGWGYYRQYEERLEGFIPKELESCS